MSSKLWFSDIKRTPYISSAYKTVPGRSFVLKEFILK